MSTDIARLPQRDRDPSGVPLVIEDGWEPSLEAPLPKMRCVALVNPETMERCGRWSIRGLSECSEHAGYENFPSVRAYTDAIIESARLRLLGMADQAVDALGELLGPETKQSVRMRAVEVALDRAGVTTKPQKQEVEVNVTHTDMTAVLAERLDRLARGTVIEGEAETA